MPRQEAWGTVLDHTELPVPGGRDSRERSPGGIGPHRRAQSALRRGAAGSLSYPDEIGPFVDLGPASHRTLAWLLGALL